AQARTRHLNDHGAGPAGRKRIPTAQGARRSPRSPSPRARTASAGASLPNHRRPSGATSRSVSASPRAACKTRGSSHLTVRSAACSIFMGDPLLTAVQQVAVLRALNEVAQQPSAARVTQLREHLSLDLPDPLAAHTELAPYLLQRPRPHVLEAESK